MIPKSRFKTGFQSVLYSAVLNSFSKQVLFVSQLPTLGLRAVESIGVNKFA